MPRTYQLHIEYFNINYSTFVELTVENVEGINATSAQVQVFPKKKKVFAVRRKGYFVFGINGSTGRTITTGTHILHELGAYMIAAIPPLATFFSLLNVLKIVALTPARFRKLYGHTLSLFVIFTEDDSYGILPDAYSEEYKVKATYIPPNKHFTFISVYPRMRGVKILFRLIINISIFLYFKNKSDVNHSVRQANSRPVQVRAFFVRMMVGMDHTNFAVNVLLIGISITKSPSIFEILIILIDGISLLAF